MDKQFKIDLHRINLNLDGKQNKNHEDVKKYLYRNLSKKEAKTCIFFLTQTSLADFFIPECIKKRYCNNFR